MSATVKESTPFFGVVHIENLGTSIYSSGCCTSSWEKSKPVQLRSGPARSWYVKISEKPFKQLLLATCPKPPKYSQNTFWRHQQNAKTVLKKLSTETFDTKTLGRVACIPHENSCLCFCILPQISCEFVVSFGLKFVEFRTESPSTEKKEKQTNWIKNGDHALASGETRDIWYPHVGQSVLTNVGHSALIINYDDPFEAGQGGAIGFRVLFKIRGKRAHCLHEYVEPVACADYYQAEALSVIKVLPNVSLFRIRFILQGNLSICSCHSLM